MPLPLPNLDDRRWVDLVAEGQALIPLYARETWTDHNAHDPGITLVELFAWIAEMDIYQLNRIPDRHKLKFPALVGITQQPPCPARTVLSFIRVDGAPLSLPAEVEFAGLDPFGLATSFRTLDPITIAPGRIQAVQVKDEKGFHNLTDSWLRGESFAAFGADSKAGAELYLGFSHPWPAGEMVSLYFSFADPRTGEAERHRLLVERSARQQACRPPLSDFPCSKGTPSLPAADAWEKDIPPHHGVRLVWEIRTSAGAAITWEPLQADQVIDETRALTLSGPVRIRPPAGMAKETIGQIGDEFYYLRVRFESGSYDAAPMLQNVALNAVAAEQAVSVGAVQTIGDRDVEAVLLGESNGAPTQEFTLPEAPVHESSFQLFTFEGNEWRIWQLRPDFDASARVDLHYRFDPSLGQVAFGDGENGRVPPAGTPIYAGYRATRAETGNLVAHTINQLAGSPHNRAVVQDFDAVSKRFPVTFRVTDQALLRLGVEGVPEAILKKLEGIKNREIQGEADFLRTLKVVLGDEPAARYKSGIFRHARSRCDVAQADCIGVTNPVPATGGAPAETLAHAIGRAIELMETSQRAVTLQDYETLALQTPGVRLARVAARANLYPSFPCLKAPGLIMLIILPYLPVDRPMPSLGLRRMVRTYLVRRRIVGTRVEVMGPTYRDVAVRAKVRACTGINKADLRQKIAETLNNFLHPLRGGPDGSGWPFGRDVYRTEILQVIDQVPGVDHVLSLELFAEGCEPQCGNVCLIPTALVAAGQHEIDVVGGEHD